MGTKNLIITEGAQKLGFKAQFKTNSSIDEIRKLISDKIPPIIGWITPEGEDHSSVVCGIDKTYIYIVDPKPNKIRKIKINEFEKRWLNIYCDDFTLLKMLITHIKLFLNNKINKKNNYNLPLKEKEIIHKGLTIIKPN